MSIKEPIKSADDEQPFDIRTIALDNLVPSPYQVRNSYDQAKLEQLADSIAQDGVIQAITICPVGDGKFEVCAGWGRVEASRIAGKKEIPAIIRHLSEGQKARLGIMENIQRQNLNIVETARAYEVLRDICKMSQEEIGEAVGVSRDVVAQALRILKFPQAVQNLLSRGIITTSHGEALARLGDNPELLSEGIGEVISEKLTSTQSERLVAELLERTALRKDINFFVNSEEFLVTIRYLLPFVPEQARICPLCLDFKMKYNEDDGISRCETCGWNSADADTKLKDLTRRARIYLLKKKGIKNSFTRIWEDRELP